MKHSSVNVWIRSAMGCIPLKWLFVSFFVMSLNVLWFLPFMSYIRVCMHFIRTVLLWLQFAYPLMRTDTSFRTFQFLCYVSTTVNVPLENNETQPVFLSYDYNSLYRFMFTSAAKSCSSHWPYFGDSFAASANPSHSYRKITVSCLSLQVFLLIIFSLFFITS